MWYNDIQEVTFRYEESKPFFCGLVSFPSSGKRDRQQAHKRAVFCYAEIMNGYTQFPNWTIDNIMPACTANEWRVVCSIIRKTNGWGKPHDEISLSQFAELTGIKSRPTLVKAIDGVMNKGFVIRKKSRNSFAYEIVNGLETKPVQKLNQFRNKTDNGLETKPKMVQKLNTQKKKEKKDSDQDDPLSELMDFFINETNCRAPNGDIRVKWLDPLIAIYKASGERFEETKKRIVEAVSILREKGYTIANPGSIQNTAVSIVSIEKKTEIGYR